MINLPLPQELTDVKWRSKTKRWFDKNTEEWQARTLYVRGTKGNRTEKYAAPIRYMDKLLLIGVFNHKTKNFEEVAFSWLEQRDIWKTVMSVVYKFKERQKVFDQWKKELEDFVHEGGLNPIFISTNVKEVEH